MKKILVLTSTFPRWKGDTVPPFVFELSKRLAKQFEVHVLAPYSKGSKKYEKIDGMYIHRFKYWFNRQNNLADGAILPNLKKNKLLWLQVPPFVISEFFVAWSLVRKYGIEIVHAHWVIPQGFTAFLIKRFLNVPYIVTCHGSDIEKLKSLSFIKKRIFQNAETITVVSNHLKKEIDQFGKKLYEKTEIIPMGIDTQIFEKAESDVQLKEKYNIKGPLLLFVGRLSPEKGVDLLIEAMPKVISFDSNVKLLVVGDGILMDSIKRKIKKLGIAQNVILEGWIENKKIPKYYKTSDVFVCPSLREGSPVAYIEAIASDTKIVVGDTPIARELVSRFGGIVVKQNKEDIAKGIIKALQKKGISKANIKEYNWNHISLRFMKLIK